MVQFWVTEAKPGLMKSNDAMSFLNEVAHDMPEWELVCIDPQGRAVYRKED